MTEAERGAVTSSSRSSGASGDPFERAKRQLVLACAAIGGGLAVAGSVDSATGGVLLLIGWLIGIAALHRLGRTGSDPGAEGRGA